MSLSDIFNSIFGSSSKRESTFSPQQQQLMDQFMKGIENNPTYNAGNSYLQNILSGNPEAFQAFEQPFKQQFEQETLPMIGERFAGMGTGSGALSSSGLNNSLARAGSDLSTNLASMRSGLQMQAAGQALPYAQQPFSNQLAGMGINTQAERPGTPGALQQLLMALSQGLMR